MAVDLEDIRKRVSKKATFEEAVADLQKLLRDNPSQISQEAVFNLMERIMVLLRTRFTSPAFWRAGRGLYETAKVGDRFCLEMIDSCQNSNFALDFAFGTRIHMTCRAT